MSIYIGINPSASTDPETRIALQVIDDFLREQFRVGTGSIETRMLQGSAVSATSNGSGGNSIVSLPTTESVRASVLHSATAGNTGLLILYHAAYDTLVTATIAAQAAVRLYIGGTLTNTAQRGFISQTLTDAGDSIRSSGMIGLQWFEATVPSGDVSVEIRDLRVGGSADTDARYRGDIAPGRLTILELKR